MNKTNKINLSICVLQSAVIIILGVILADSPIRIVVSTAGIIFNFLVCVGKKGGFIIGALYAAAYGVIAFTDGIYASAFFMIIIQVPSAIYSFVSWNKSQARNSNLEKMNKIGILISVAALLGSYVIIYFILIALNGSGAIFDAFFLTTSLISCILLAKYYRAAYVFIFLSGVAGTALWAYQMFVTGQGVALMTLNAFVLVNALIGIAKNYRKLN